MNHGEANWQSADILGAALEAFIREHEYCGELDTGLEGDRVWMTCTCGAVVNLILEPIEESRRGA